MAATMNEQLIRDVVADVLSRIGAPAPVAAPVRPAASTEKQDCGCHGKNNGNGAPAVAARGGQNGVFSGNPPPKRAKPQRRLL